jgi:hypothetical protein
MYSPVADPFHPENESGPRVRIARLSRRARACTLGISRSVAHRLFCVASLVCAVRARPSFGWRFARARLIIELIT